MQALEEGQLAGYAGDVWFPQPPPADHPWREMPWHAMTPHISGTSLSAQVRDTHVLVAGGVTGKEGSGGGKESGDERRMAA